LVYYNVLTKSIAKTGTWPLSYRWHKNGVGLIGGGNISGTIAITLTIRNVRASDVGSFTVVVAIAEGSVTSDAATLTVDLGLTYTVTRDGNGGLGTVPIKE